MPWVSVFLRRIPRVWVFPSTSLTHSCLRPMQHHQIFAKWSALTERVFHTQLAASVTCPSKTSRKQSITLSERKLCKLLLFLCLACIVQTSILWCRLWWCFSAMYIVFTLCEGAYLDPSNDPFPLPLPPIDSSRDLYVHQNIFFWLHRQRCVINPERSLLHVFDWSVGTRLKKWKHIPFASVMFTLSQTLSPFLLEWNMKALLQFIYFSGLHFIVRKSQTKNQCIFFSFWLVFFYRFPSFLLASHLHSLPLSLSCSFFHGDYDLHLALLDRFLMAEFCIITTVFRRLLRMPDSLVHLWFDLDVFPPILCGYLRTWVLGDGPQENCPSCTLWPLLGWLALGHSLQHHRQALQPKWWICPLGTDPDVSSSQSISPASV